MRLLLENDHFLVRNQHYILAIMLIALITLIVFAVLIHMKSAKLTKSLLVNKFKVLDMNEKNTKDDAPLYTVVISNNSMNAISIASIGFEHDGDYFNFRNECKAQLENKNQDLVILPRSSIKLRLYKVQLESTIFATSRRKKLGKIRVYIIGLGGENYKAKAKVIGKKMQESYKEYYAYHEIEVITKFLSICEHKIKSNIKLKFFEKLRYNSLSKRHKDLQIPEYVSLDEQYKNAPKEIPTESHEPMPFSIKDCEIAKTEEIAITTTAQNKVEEPKQVIKPITEDFNEPEEEPETVKETENNEDTDL